MGYILVLRGGLSKYSRNWCNFMAKFELVADLNNSIVTLSPASVIWVHVLIDQSSPTWYFYNNTSTAINFTSAFGTCIPRFN